MNGGVFINYRGEDARSYGVLLYREMTRHLGNDLVFVDSESIAAGADFAEEILGRVRSCQVLLAVIGPHWLTAADPSGRRRIDDPQDWIRRELAEAFAIGTTVIPVLTDDAVLPGADQLPPDIAALAGRQFRRLRHRDAGMDLGRLVSDVTGSDPRLAAAARRRAEPRVGSVSPTSGETATDPLTLAAAQLAEAVRRQWTMEAGLRSLRRPEPLRVRWSPTDRPVFADPEPIVGGTDRGAKSGLSSDDPRRLVEVFRQLPTRQMVILGAPAAGKTVLALLFVLALLDEPVADQPVPVLLTASSWNPRLEHLHSWLARKLVEEYPALGDQRSYGPDAAVRLVTEGRIMPVIDGLDEMPAALHGIAIDALDRATTGSHPLVVTCRTDEYEAAVRDQGAILSRAAVMEIKPVDLADAGRFLTANWSQARQRWQPVLAGLGDEPDMPLARALTSPLMVTLARTVYAPTTTTPGELRDEHMFADWTAIERHLLGSFIPAAYTEQPAPPVLGSKPVAAGRGRYRPNQAWVWLRFLAWHLDKLGTRDLAWWELPGAVPLITRALLAGLTSGLIGAVAGYVADGATTSLLFGLAFAVATATSQAFGRVSRPSHLELRFRGTAPRFLARFTIGYGAGVAVGLAFGLDYHVALAAAVAPGLALASHAWWNTPTDATRASTPGKVLRSERTSALALGLVVGVAFGVITGLIYGSAAGVAFDTEETILAGLATLIATGTVGYLRYGLVGGVAYGLAGWVIAGLTAASPYHGPISNETLLGLAYGIAFGTAIGYNIILSRAWGRYQLSRYWLALRGHLPWRLTSFLGDAHQRGVLRQAGGMYQFRHALLQDHLAESG